MERQQDLSDSSGDSGEPKRDSKTTKHSQSKEHFTIGVIKKELTSEISETHKPNE